MKKGYLIQRILPPIAIRRKKEPALENVMHLDYMGAAEFEFGAIGRAVEALLEKDFEAGLLSPSKTGVASPLWYICLTENVSEMLDRVIELAINDTDRYFKEKPYFFDSMGEDPKEQFIGWWDLENNYILFSDPQIFEALIKLIAEVKRAEIS